MATIQGRDAELELLRVMLDAARSGKSGALVLTGHAGVGKTLLLSHAVSAAAGFRVIRCTGVRAESDLAHAGLQALLRPAASLIDQLPSPQSAALRGAFGLEASHSPDPYLLGLATLSLLAELAAAEPVLCIVDDAHWLDAESAAALCFAARRLDADAVVMIFAARPGPFAAEGIPKAEIGALTEPGATALLAEVAADLSPAARRRVLDEARGNPLALVELPRALKHGDDQADLPLPARLRDAYAAQVAALTAPAQRILLISAAEGTGDLRLLMRAGQSLGITPVTMETALEEAERSGLVHIDDGLRFRHPLIRAAIYETATREQRRKVHRTIGAALNQTSDGDRRAWHLAAATLEPDDEVAAELERTASRAAQRNGYDTARRAVTRSAELTRDPAQRASRLLAAAEYALLAGQPTAATELVRQAEDGLTGRAFALRVARVQGTVAHQLGQTHKAHSILTAAADLAACDDPSAAGQMLAETVIACRHDFGLTEQAYRRLLALPGAEDLPTGPLPGRSPTVASVQMQRGAQQWLLRGMARDPSAEGLFQAAAAAHLGGDLKAAAEHGQAALELCRADGLVGPLPWGFAILSATLIRLNRFRSAAATTAEGLEVAEMTGQALQAATLQGMLAYLAAVSGDLDGAQRLAAAATHTFAGTDNPTGATWAEQALALVDLVSGQPAAALDRLERSVSADGSRAIALIQGLPDHVEAAVRAGATDKAEMPLALLREWSETAVPAPWISATLDRCQAAVSDSAEDRFERAIRGYELAGHLFDQARTQLLFGEWLRRTRRPGESRVILRAALDGFERAEATPWAERTRAELRAAGERMAEPVKPANRIHTLLTPQEFQIVQMAASGATNREIAARIFVSPRTVSHHLYRAFPKLGVATRTELARLVLTPDAIPH
jgi:DNA-binding CsgD family transcriptional regulator